MHYVRMDPLPVLKRDYGYQFCHRNHQEIDLLTIWVGRFTVWCRSREPGGNRLLEGNRPILLGWCYSAVREPCLIRLIFPRGSRAPSISRIQLPFLASPVGRGRRNTFSRFVLEGEVARKLLSSAMGCVAFSGSSRSSDSRDRIAESRTSGSFLFSFQCIFFAECAACSFWFLRLVDSVLTFVATDCEPGRGADEA